MSRAPSLHNSQPWHLTITGTTCTLSELTDVRLIAHDPTNRDRHISCGAALANLELAISELGRHPIVRYRPDSGPAVATVIAAAPRRHTIVDRHLYNAIAFRRSYRHPFGLSPITDDTFAHLVRAARVNQVNVLRVTTSRDLAVLAAALEYTSRVFRDDQAYQRELLAWTAGEIPCMGSCDGIPPASLSEGPMPEAGLVRSHTPIPDFRTLSTHLANECLLILTTKDDERRSHVSSGRAMQRLWLAATAQGLVGTIMTQPLQLTELRRDLKADLHLNGHPQLLLRLGHPITPVPPSPRKPLGELFDHDG